MKYLALSLITTGFDPSKSDILEVGAIVEDSENHLNYDDIPKLRFWVDKEYYKGSPKYLNKHREIIAKIDSLRNDNSIRLKEPDLVINKLVSFIKPHFERNFKINPFCLASDNSYILLSFLRRLKDFNSLPISKTIINPCQYYIDWGNSEVPPNLEDALKAARLRDDNSGATDSLKRSWDIIRLIRNKQFI